MMSHRTILIWIAMLWTRCGGIARAGHSTGHDDGPRARRSHRRPRRHQEAAWNDSRNSRVADANHDDGNLDRTHYVGS